MHFRSRWWRYHAEQSPKTGIHANPKATATNPKNVFYHEHGLFGGQSRTPPTTSRIFARTHQPTKGSNTRYGLIFSYPTRELYFLSLVLYIDSIKLNLFHLSISQFQVLTWQRLSKHWLNLNTCRPVQIPSGECRPRLRISIRTYRLYRLRPPYRLRDQFLAPSRPRPRSRTCRSLAGWCTRNHLRSWAAIAPTPSGGSTTSGRRVRIENLMVRGHWKSP